MNASFGNFNSLFRTVPSSQLSDIGNQIQDFARSSSRLMEQYRSITSYANEKYQAQINDIIKATSLALPAYRVLDSWLKEPFPPFTNADILKETSRIVFEDEVGLLKPLSGKEVSGNNLFDHEELIELLTFSNFALSHYHYQEAIDSFESGLYAASNAQCRTFLESFLRELSLRVTGKERVDPHSAIDILLNNSFLTKTEWQILKALWSMSNTDGAHPGYSDHHKSKSRLLMATGIAISIIAKLEA